jgi:hypothetical protein
MYCDPFLNIQVRELREFELYALEPHGFYHWRSLFVIFICCFMYFTGTQTALNISSNILP